MLKVAAVQQAIDGTLDENVQRICAAIDALEPGTEIACFPELSLGLDPLELSARAHALGRVSEAIRRRAPDAPWTVVGGYAARREGVFNEVYLLSPQGRLGRTYQKINPSPYEGDIRAGDRLGLVDTPLARVGIIDCLDIVDAALVRELVGNGAQVILSPACFPHNAKTSKYGEYAGWPAARARENRVPVVFCDAVLERPAFRTWAHSQIISASGEILETARGQQTIYSELKLPERPSRYAP